MRAPALLPATPDGRNVSYEHHTMHSPASPSSSRPGAANRKRCSESSSAGRSPKRLRPLSPPSSSTPPHPCEPQPQPSDRSLSIAAWVAETSAVAMAPEPEAAVSEAVSASSRASSRSQATQTKGYRALVRKAGIVPVSWSPLPDAVQAAVDAVAGGAGSRQLDRIAERFCKRTRELTEDAANETAWRTVVQNMVETVIEARSDTKLSYDQNWCQELVPPQRQPGPAAIVPQHRPWQSLPTNAAAATAPAQLKRPRPDLQLSLSPDALGPIRTDLLEMLADSNTLISNPSKQLESGYFPFFVCELKSGATAGNLLGAQNQASVAAASALRILNDLQALAPRSNMPSLPVFALCAEDFMYFLYVYYFNQESAQFVGKLVQHWISTTEERAQDFVRCVAGIAEWATTAFKDGVSKALDAITQDGNEAT